MFYTIYKITNLVNGKTYIGKHQTKDLNDSYMGSGKLLKKAIAKYGLDSFKKDVLHVFDTEAEMNAKERELVVVSEDTYNLCPGGHGGFGYINSAGLGARQFKDNPELQFMACRRGAETTNRRLKTDEKFYRETVAKIKKSLIGRKPTFLDRKHSPKTLANMRELKIGHGIGRTNSQYGTMWITDGTKNKKINKVDNIPEGWYKGRVAIIV